jgi:hypothetical protein
MTQAETQVKAFHERTQRNGQMTTKWRASPSAKIERDPEVPGATFYRYPDESMVRIDRKNCEIIDIQIC